VAGCLSDLKTQAECDFYQLWIKRIFSLYSEAEKMPRWGHGRLRKRQQKPCVKYPRLGVSGDLRKGQVKTDFPGWLRHCHLGHLQQGPQEKERMGGQEVTEEPCTLQGCAPWHAWPPSSSSKETTSFCGLTLADCQGFNKGLVMCTFEMCWWRRMACLTRV
jgi:hypothetical protein